MKSSCYLPTGFLEALPGYTRGSYSISFPGTYMHAGRNTYQGYHCFIQPLLIRRTLLCLETVFTLTYSTCI